MIWCTLLVLGIKTSSSPPYLKLLIPRDFKLSNEEKFKTDLKNSLRITNISSYCVFEKIFLKVWGDMLRLKTKQSELMIHHMSQKL